MSQRFKYNNGIRSVSMRFFSRRIEWARAGSGPVPVLQHQTVRQLQAKFGDDIRTMEAALYNSIEQMSEVGHVRLLD